MQVKTVAFYHWIFPFGGAETVTCNLGRYFAAQGFRLLVYTRHLVPELLTKEIQAIFELRLLPNTTRGNTPDNIEYLCESLNAEQVDVLIIQGATDFPFREVHPRIRSKVIFCMHSIPLWEAYVARSKRCSDLPKQTFMRKLEFLLVRKPADLFTDKQKRRALKLYTVFFSSIDRLVTLCPEYGEEMERLIRKSRCPGSDAPTGKFISICNPLPPSVLPIDQQMPKEKIVLYVGRLARADKRVDRLLTIWHKIESSVPGWRLQILGSGEEMEALQKQATRLGLERIEFLGYRTDVAAFYRRASFICLTSTFEGYPMSLVEAQQYGVIPVSFDSFASIHRITRNGEAGIVVPAYNLRKYAKTLRAALIDETLQKQMREKCYLAAEQYTQERIGREWLRLFKEL